MKKGLTFISSICLFTLLTYNPFFAQSSFGGYPNSIQWNQINTNLVRVIFPDSLEEKAQRIANIIHYMNEENVGLLGKSRGKVDILLQNQQVISNGFAQVAPLKSEFFHQPPQDTYGESSIDWIDLLAVHEYRHVNQFFNTRQGLSKVLYWLIGDYGWGAAIGLTAPAWFLEGDAVVNETALSISGRGRTPSFSVNTRALADDGVQYKYMKAMSGSYKDVVPNHYETGYLICSEIRREYGNESWDLMTKRASNYRGIIAPFSRAVKRVTGTKLKHHYYNAFEEISEAVPEEASPSLPITEEQKKNVVNYKYPIIQDGEIYYAFATRRDIRGIYKHNPEGEDELIAYMGLALDAYFSKSKNLFAWSELQRDLRRGNVNYSNIILYNKETGKKELIGRNERYFSPYLHPDGESIIFIESVPSGMYSIVHRNLKSNEQKTIIASTKTQFIYPSYSETGDRIFSIIKEGNYYAMAEIKMDGTMDRLTDWDIAVLGPPRSSGNYLIFNANYDARDNVYALDLKNKNILRISDDNVGMYHPSNYVDGKIVVERPHARGFLIHEITTSPEDWNVENTSKRMEEVPYYLETEHLEGMDMLGKVPDNEYETSKYPRNSNSINVHSWVLNATEDDIGLTLFSQNLLNSVSIEPSISYNTNLQGAFLNLSTSYGRYFPVYGLDYSQALPREQKSSDGERTFNVAQVAIRPSVLIPLNLTKGTYSKLANFSTSLTLDQTHIEELESKERFDQNGTTLNNVLSFRSTRLAAVQNYYPKWGVNTTLFNRFRFNDNHNVFQITNDFYVPGFRKNHGFKLEFDYAVKNATAEDRIAHFDNFDYAEGFRAVNYDQLLGLNVNYGMPLLYPDWGFWNFIYFKRVNSVLFHNYNSVMFENQRTELQSSGFDLLFDLVFNNNVFSEISVGLRSAYLQGPLPEGKDSRYHFEFIVDIPAF